MEKKIKSPVMGKVAKVPVILQLETLECGAASLAMVMAYYHKWIPLEQVRIDCGVSRDGSNAKNILLAARNYGMTAKGFRFEPETLKNKGKFPCIIHWNFNHFVVLDGFRKNKAILNDPAKGVVAVSMEEFDQSFTGICIMLEPAEGFVAEGSKKSIKNFAAKQMKGTGSAMLFTVLVSLITTLLGVINPVFSRIFMDKLLSGLNPTWIYPFFLFLLMFAVIQIVVSGMQAIYALKIQGKLAIKANAQYMWHIPDIFDCFLKEACLHPREILWIDLSAEKVKTVTYEEAAQMVVWLGEKIRKQKEMPGAGNKSVEKPETAQRQPVIGLYLKRSYRLPLAMLAVLSIEGIFYPVDIREKGTRLKAMQRQVDLLLTEEMLTAWIEQWKREKDVLEKQTGVFFAQSRREHGEGGEILAYRMSTSGSTGQPKVAEIYRKSLNLRLAWMIREFSMKGSRVLQKTKDTFDVSLWELLLPAMAGGSLVLIPDGKETDPAYLWQTIKKYKINQVHFVPSMLSVFMSWVEKNKETEKETFLCENVLASGEELRADLVRRFMAAFPETAINNLYGPAECTIDVSYHRCRPGEKIVPIGKPVWNTELKIINRKKQEIPFGYIGEILILGDLVGKGYVSTAESENQRFISVEGKRGYRTGDLGYVDDQGEIVYVGRTDREIKHRGMRVNLAAIEKETTGLPGITHAAALVEERHLLLFVETTRTKEQVKGTLAQHLPPRYLPDILLVMEKIPCNKNGKCDYRALSEFYQEQIKQNGGKKSSDTERDDHENPRRIKSVEEDILCSINKVTGTGWIAPDDFIFDCGLDSLSVVELILELEQKGYTARFADVYETGTVKKLAQRIMEKNREEDRILRLYSDWIPLGREQETQKQAQKEKTEEKAKLVVAVPYAGTDPYLFHALAEKLTARGYTFLACAAEKKEQTVEELAEKIEKELTPWIQKEDTEIVLFGCCVGAALTLALGQRLERHPSVTLRLVLAGSLPASFLGTKAIKKKRILLWDLLSQKAGECFLSCLYGEKVHLSEAMYERLKEEARMYVDYFEKIRWEKSVVKADATVIFGKKDLLTLGYGKRYFQWKNFIEGNIRLVEIPGAAHYFVRSCGETVAEAVLFGE